MNEVNIPQSVLKNLEVLNTICNSGKELCFDESMLLSREGREILLYMRIHMGSQRFFIHTSVEQNLRKLNGTALPPRKAEEVKKALLFLDDLLIENKDYAQNPLRPYMLTRDISLAEFLAERSSEERVYILNNEQKVLTWRTERENNNRRTLAGVQRALSTGLCWLTSSALASSRATRFIGLLPSLPETMQSRVHLLDISKNKALDKTPGTLKTTSEISKTRITEHNVAGAFPIADEITLLTAMVTYSDKNVPLYTVWNDIQQAEELRNKLSTLPNGKELLAKVGFCELSWYGNLVPLRNMNDNLIAQKLLAAATIQTTPTTPANEEQDLTVLDMAFELGLQPHIIVGSLFSRGLTANPTTKLSKENVNYLRNKFSQSTPSTENGSVTTPTFTAEAPQVPDAQTIRSFGPMLGQVVREAPLSQIRELIANNRVKRELALIYARRWDRADIVGALLDDSESLSSYCFENWFKRSQNATRNIGQEDLLLNEKYYSLLRRLIGKSPDLSGCNDSMGKLHHLSINAITQTARKRAADIMQLAQAKGARLSTDDIHTER